MITYVCEVCEKTEELTEQEAFDQGWDYPPFIGKWGIVSPRTCGDCVMDDTAWWALVINKVPLMELEERHLRTVIRIQQEVE